MSLRFYPRITRTNPTSTTPYTIKEARQKDRDYADFQVALFYAVITLIVSSCLVSGLMEYAKFSASVRMIETQSQQTGSK